MPSGTIKKCLECGKEFHVVGQPKNRNFCSKECDKLHRKNGKIIKEAGNDGFGDIGIWRSDCHFRRSFFKRNRCENNEVEIG